MVFLKEFKEFFEKVNFEKLSRRQKSMKKFPGVGGGGGKEFKSACLGTMTEKVLKAVKPNYDSN